MLEEALDKANALGERSVESLDEFKAVLQKIRENGFSEYHPGNREVVGLAVPVFCGSEVVAALGVYLPSMRFRGEHQSEVVDLLKKAGKGLSLRLSAEMGEGTSGLI